MRELWLQIDGKLPASVKKKLLKASKQLASGVIVESVDLKIAKQTGAKVLTGALKKAIRNKNDLNDLVRRIAPSAPKYLIVSCPNWKVIPIENLIAALHGKSKLLAEVKNADEARLALETLELGVDGVVIKAGNESELAAASRIVKATKTRVEEKKEEPRIKLASAKIIEVKLLKIGARVCIDTCDLMKHGEGMLVGSQSSGLFLVQAEVEESPHVAPRPFRVNAGAVSLYTLTPSGNTVYLSELKAGEEVLIVDREGRKRSTAVGRVKIEWRPLMLIEAEAQGRKIKTIVQNAETIRLVTAKGSKSVSELKPGDKVLVRLEEGGRHFGTLVKEESVLEK